MNISPINNYNNSFKGTIHINNHKTGLEYSIITDRLMDNKITKSFSELILCPDDYLNKVKKYVKDISQITNTNLKRLKYPKKDKLALNFNSIKDKTQLNIPGYFSITHNLK